MENSCLLESAGVSGSQRTPSREGHEFAGGLSGCKAPTEELFHRVWLWNKDFPCAQLLLDSGCIFNYRDMHLHKSVKWGA